FAPGARALDEIREPRSRIGDSCIPRETSILSRSGAVPLRADCAAGAGGRGARLRADLAGAASDHRDDDLALGPAAFDVGERLCGVIERVRPVDDGTEDSGVDELGDLA